jgi:predicted flap endonuclease-1-like 5' DNA nuclease
VSVAGEVIVWMLVACALGVAIGRVWWGKRTSASSPPRPSEPATPTRSAAPARVVAPDPLPAADPGPPRPHAIDSLGTDADADAESPPDDRDYGPDELTAIVGIGPYLASRLQAAGVTSYRALALLDPADLDRIRAGLPDADSRLQRDRWQEQARSLHEEHYGEPLAQPS